MTSISIEKSTGTNIFACDPQNRGVGEKQSWFLPRQFRNKLLLLPKSNFDKFSTEGKKTYFLFCCLRLSVIHFEKKISDGMEYQTDHIFLFSNPHFEIDMILHMK